MSDTSETLAATAADTKPKQRIFMERIGDRDFELAEERLDVSQDVVLWSENPRLQPAIAATGIASEAELEAELQQSSGYDTLRKSIEDLGQMEPIYVWRADEDSKYVVFEGATRVAILRDLNRRNATGQKAGKYRWVKAKILPSTFTEIERAILLARIHVRGSGVRAWGRYIEAKFIHETVTGPDGGPGLMMVSEMARHMAKSLSWVQRLRDAYEFAQRFVEHVDSEEAQQLAARHFSTLEEISKATTIGSHLRDYNNPTYDDLRSDVFEMVRNEVFKEYRDARFLKDFHEDPDKWAQLKTNEKHIASRLANEVKSNSSSLKSKIATMEQQVQRAIDRGDTDFSEDDVEALQKAVSQIQKRLHQGIRPFRIALIDAARAMSEASMADVKEVTHEELTDFNEALEYFQELVVKHGKAAV